MITFMGVSCMSCITHQKRYIVVPPNGQVQQQYYDSVVLLYLKPGPKGSSNYQATGFAITEDYLLTAGHFCTRLQNNRQKGINSKYMGMQGSDRHGNPYEAGDAIIVANHHKHDMCIIKSNGHGLTPLPLLGDLSFVETEDKITTIGAPHGFFPVRRDGHVISKDSSKQPQLQMEQLLFIEVNIEPGSSGSPVIWNGQVIGIVVKLIYDNHLKDGALATRGDHVVEFVDKCIDRPAE